MEYSLEELSTKIREAYNVSVFNKTIFSIENESIKLFLGTELLKSAAITIKEENENIK